MKKPITILLLFAFYLCDAQIEKEKEFQKTVNQVIAAYNKKNSAAFNKFVNKNNGIYFLVKNGVYNFWYNKNIVRFNDTLDNHKLPFPYNSMLGEQKLPSNFKLSYTSYPVFNCNTKKLKIGLFVDTSYEANLLSNLIKKYIKFNDIGLDKNELKNELKIINKIEAKSRKIIIIGKNNSNWGENFIFYLTYIDHKWFISIIDFATFDCSA
jgi:hypothetical protein